MIKKLGKTGIVKIFTIALLVIAIIVMENSFAQANNCQNEPWSFETGSSGGTGFIVSTGRNKTDTTSVYIKCNAGNADKSFIATAYGSKTSIGGYINCVYNGKSSKAYSVKKGSEIYMINYIKEAEYNYANVYYDARYTPKTIFSGVWSPDSVQ